MHDSAGCEDGHAKTCSYCDWSSHHVAHRRCPRGVEENYGSGCLAGCHGSGCLCEASLGHEARGVESVNEALRSQKNCGFVAHVKHDEAEALGKEL